VPYNFSILQTSKVNAMIVRRTIPNNKTLKTLKLSTKSLKSKNTPNNSKLSKIVKKTTSISPSSKATSF
jgi:hypothetical protein